MLYKILKGGESILPSFPTAEPKQVQQLSEYSKLEQLLLKKIERIAQRILSKPTVANNDLVVSQSGEDDIPKSKRRAANSEEDFFQAIVGELNFAQYKTAYTALVKYYDLAIPGHHSSSSSQFSTEPERKIFLQNFAKALYQKLQWER